jgi:hypothetical protein
MARIRKQAFFIARNRGWQTNDGYIYDDDTLRIAVSSDMTTIYYPNESGDLKMVYSYNSRRHEIIYLEGEWESKVAIRYESLKRRLKR